MQGLEGVGGLTSVVGVQDNVALIAVLEALDPPNPDASNPSRRQLICVANTHIHANPELNDVKLWQVKCLDGKGRLRKKHSDRHGQALQNREVLAAR